MKRRNQAGRKQKILATLLDQPNGRGRSIGYNMKMHLRDWAVGRKTGLGDELNYRGLIST
jgi:hypothetical protein